MNRRHFVTMTGAVALSMSAGCLGDDDDGGSSEAEHDVELVDHEFFYDGYSPYLEAAVRNNTDEEKDVRPWIKAFDGDEVLVYRNKLVTIPPGETERRAVPVLEDEQDVTHYLIELDYDGERREVGEWDGDRMRESLDE